MECNEKEISALPSLREDSASSSGKLLSCATMSCRSIECKVSGLGRHKSHSLNLDMTFRQGPFKGCWFEGRKLTFCSSHSSRPERLTEVEIGDYSVQTFMTNATATTFKTNPATVEVAVGPTTLFYPQRAVTGFQGRNSIDTFVPESGS